MKVLTLLCVLLVCSQEMCEAQTTPPRVRVTGVAMTSNGFYHVGPDPSSKFELLKFLSEETEVAKYIGVTEQQSETVRKLFVEASEKEVKLFKELRSAGKGSQVSESIMAARKEMDSIVDEVLTPAQLERLKLLAMRIEVIRMGLPISLTHGRLAETLGVYEGQKTDLLRRAQRIEADTQAKIAVLLKEAETATLELLTPEQRTKAKLVLGDTHDFVESPRARKLLMEFMEKTVEGPPNIPVKQSPGNR